MVVSLDALVRIPLHRKTPAAQLRVHVQSVEEALDVKTEDVFFPLREAYNVANETLEGAAEHANVHVRPVAEDLPEPVQSDVVDQFEDPAELEMDPQHNETPSPVSERSRAIPPPAISGSDDKRVAPRSRSR